MDAYSSHVKFEKEVGKPVNQTHYLSAFYAEHETEVKRLRYNGTISRLTSKVNSEVGEVVHNRFLDWYKKGSNACTSGHKGRCYDSLDIPASELYSIITSCRYAALFIFVLKCVHDSEGK